MPGRLLALSWIAIASLTACSVIAPVFGERPNGSDQALAARCTLETMQRRKQLPLRPQTSGTAQAFVIRKPVGGATDRVVKSADEVYLRTPDQSWTLTAVDVLGRTRPKATLIRDGATIRLRTLDTARPIDIDEHGTVPTSAARSGSELVIYKADVPDATMPESCDAIIRDGDYVFLRTRRPDVWLGTNRAGAAPEASRSNAPDVRLCVDEAETCYEDAAGRLFCAWAPDCSGTSSGQRSPNSSDAAGY